MKNNNFVKFSICILFVFVLFFLAYNVSYFSEPENDSTTFSSVVVKDFIEDVQLDPIEEKIIALGEEDDGNSLDTEGDNDFPKERSLVLSNGREISVTYKLDDSLNLPRPVKETFDGYIFDLIELADNGVPSAASSVAALLKQCSKVPRSRADFESQAQNFLSSGIVRSPDPSYPDLELNHGSNEFNQAYQDLQQQYKLCSKITDQQLTEGEKYRKLALERGEFRVLSEEALASFNSDPVRFYELSERSWQLGNVGALSSISLSYTLGIVPLTSGKPDHTKAYAYELASFVIQERLLSESANNSYEIDSLRAGLEQAESFLTPQEQQEATKLADTIIAENDQCCVSIWPTE